jgi:hypothetical protein
VVHTAITSSRFVDHGLICTARAHNHGAAALFPDDQAERAARDQAAAEARTSG